MQTPYRAITCESEIISPERQESKEPKNPRNDIGKSQLERLQQREKKNIKDNGKSSVEVRKKKTIFDITQSNLISQRLLIGSL